MITRIFILSVLIFSHSLSAELTTAHRNLYHAERQNGVVHFRGAVMASPCILDSASQEQDIAMGDISARQFHQAGDQSKQVTFVVKMKDCLTGAYEYHRDLPGEMTGNRNRVYTTGEQVISLSFSGETDDVNPDLLKVQGVRGLGLRLMDHNGKPLSLNQTHNPYLLPSGDSNLTFIAALESTQKYTGAGSYYGMVRLMLEYL